MTVTIPKCQLRGMTPSDLMLNDPACKVQDHTVEVGMNYVVNVPFGGCGMIQTVDNSTGIARSIYKQTIQTRNYNSSQFLLDVRFDLECETSTFFNATYGAIKPGAHLEQGSLARQGIFQLELAVFTSDAFSTPITGNLAYIIDTPVYVEGRSEPLSNALQLKLWSCKATPTSNINDQTSYYLISNGGCQKDPTVVFYTRASNGKVRFKFNMFEFVANNSLLAVQRGSVYLHCSFIVCTTTDTTGKCGSACHSRRRRSDDVEEQTVTKTIGPFTVESNDEDEPIQTVDESISISRGLARLNGGKSPALDDNASTEGRRIEFVVQAGSISSESVSALINAASIFFFVFGVYFVLRYVRSQSMRRDAAGKCIKHTVYHDSNPREPEWCKQCCHDPVPTGNIQSTLNLNQPPPQYEE
uniref:ZP domain-containing protein n=1 Tax=Ciona savignyi TaxID=51511 RepID=H2YYP6_CIOSA